MAEAIIRAQGLTKIYTAGAGGDVVAVDGIDLEIFSGEIYGRPPSTQRSHRRRTIAAATAR